MVAARKKKTKKALLANRSTTRGPYCNVGHVRKLEIWKDFASLPTQSFHYLDRIDRAAFMLKYFPIKRNSLDKCYRDYLIWRKETEQILKQSLEESNELQKLVVPLSYINGVNKNKGIPLSYFAEEEENNDDCNYYGNLFGHHQKKNTTQKQVFT